VTHHRKLVRQLMRISATVSMVWVIGCSSSFVIYTYWLYTGRQAPAALFVVNTVFTRSIGAMDAIILGGMCTARSDKRRCGERLGCQGSSSIGDDEETGVTS
jgi:hypothetical protein